MTQPTETATTYASLKVSREQRDALKRAAINGGWRSLAAYHAALIAAGEIALAKQATANRKRRTAKERT